MAIEKDDILQAIRDTGGTVSGDVITGGSISKAAEKLGVARRTLQDRMRFYGIPKGKAGRRRKKMSYGRAKRAFSRYAPVASVAVVAVLGVGLLYRKST